GAAGGYGTAPADEGIAVGESLDRTGARGRDVRGMPKFPYQGCNLVDFVQLVLDPPGVSPVARGDSAPRNVAVIEVEQVAVGQPMDVLLSHCVVGGVFFMFANKGEFVLFAAQAPHHFPRLPVSLHDLGSGAQGSEQIVVYRVNAHSVDVRIINGL